MHAAVPTTVRTIIIGTQLIESVYAVRQHIKCPISIYPIELIDQLSGASWVHDGAGQLVLIETNPETPNFDASVERLQAQFPCLKIIRLPDSRTHPLHQRLVLAGILEATG
ncbi:hypothetical protein EBR96_09090 [bacterium]|nr:hypothetical protein [bacterium]